MKKHCCICGKRIKLLTGRVSLYDGVICSKCFDRLTEYDRDHNKMENIYYFRHRSVKDIRNMARNSIVFTKQETADWNNQMTDYTETFGDYFAYDDTGRIFRIKTGKKTFTVLPYEALTDFRLFEDTYYTTRNGVKRAVIGGILAKEKGFVLGAMSADRVRICRYLNIVVKVNEEAEEVITLKMLTFESDVTAPDYKAKKRLATEIITAMQHIRND